MEEEKEEYIPSTTQPVTDPNGKVIGYLQSDGTFIPKELLQHSDYVMANPKKAKSSQAAIGKSNYHLFNHVFKRKQAESGKVGYALGVSMLAAPVSNMLFKSIKYAAPYIPVIARTVANTSKKAAKKLIQKATPIVQNVFTYPGYTPKQVLGSYLAAETGDRIPLLYDQKRISEQGGDALVNLTGVEALRSIGEIGTAMIENPILGIQQVKE